MNKESIKKYIEQLKAENLLVKASGDTDAVVEYVTYDSRDVSTGTLFVCKGAHFKAEYLTDSAERGAVCYVSETEYDVHGIASIIVKDIRKAMPVLALYYYGDLSSKIEIIGITGTKGKSSTAFFLKTVIDEYEKSRGGNPAAICSGIYNFDGVIKEESALTTPENLELLKHVNNAVDSDMDYMVMEVSSQGLKYDRVSNINYAVAALLNIGMDHISSIEHPDFEDYFESKLLIFNQCRTACVNLDSDYSDVILERAGSAERIITYSQKNEKADVFAYNITSRDGEVRFDMRILGEIAGIKMAAIGLINVENALAAAAMAAGLGIPTEFIVKGLAIAVAPGRMEMYRSNDGKRLVIVDYAHNRMSYEKLFECLKKEFPDKDFIVVAGCVGMKAQHRRKDLPEVICHNARKFIITEVNSGDENPMAIANEIAENVKRLDGDYEIILDREMAIRRAIELQDENTIVIATGKAYESTMKRGSEVIHILTDPESVKKYINMPMAN